MGGDFDVPDCFFHVVFFRNLLDGLFKLDDNIIEIDNGSSVLPHPQVLNGIILQ